MHLLPCARSATSYSTVLWALDWCRHLVLWPRACGIATYIDGITISCNISRGISNTVILSSGHDWITVSIDKWKYDYTLFLVPTISTICLKCTIFKICWIGSHLSPMVVRFLISTSSLGGYLLRYRLYHWMKINVIRWAHLKDPIQDPTGVAGCVRALHRPVVHPKETEGRGEYAAYLWHEPWVEYFYVNEDN